MTDRLERRPFFRRQRGGPKAGTELANDAGTAEGDFRSPDGAKRNPGAELGQLQSRIALRSIRATALLRHCLRQTRSVCARERSDEAIHSFLWHGLLVRQVSWRCPAGERPVRVGRSGRPVASVAWSPATAGAKRTQRLCGGCY